MISKKTVFVVGAGASAELGLPTGEDLKGKLSKLVDIKFGFDKNNEHTGDHDIVQALRMHTQNLNQGKPGDINPYLHAAWAMVDALPISISIDNYLEAHSSDEQTNLVGKLGIVQSILKAEQNSAIKVSTGNTNNSIRFNNIRNVWLRELFLKLKDGLSREKVSQIFDNVVFISFNYDRCIKHFFRHCVKTYYGVNENAELDDIMKGLKVYHPYGCIGSLEWEGSLPAKSFGADAANTLLELASCIKTYSEQIEDEQLINTVRQAISKATNLVFLGFAFHNQNMRLLKCGVSERTMKKVYATTLGMSKGDKIAIEESILNTFDCGTEDRAYGVQLEDLECWKLIADYKRSL